MALSELITAGSAVVVSYDTGDRAAIALASDWDSDQDTHGYVRLEVPCTCLSVVRTTEQQGLPRKRLERVTRASRFLQLVRSNSGRVMIVTLDDKGRLFVSREGYDSRIEAEARLRGHRGHWPVVCLDQFCRLRPEPPQTDPFSSALPVPGTLTVTIGASLYGLFLKPRDLYDGLIVDWIFWYAAGGLFVKHVLERLEIVDHGAQAYGHPSARAPSDQPSDYQVFEKLQSGQTRPVFLGADLNEARDFVRSSSGLFLPTKSIDRVDTH
ncbi:hypothetical protein [Thiorhodococcus minor]|uniref:Uncharacterized protein n=1 Tax=Thiorhodococcus minor TaxID=57489 RepID=A0A6M0K6U7_9GAMM|nr:hypothetical protein [Thiorhodococcus minor]NEV64075.1 hypothetical protein [Thiorhodococcus minor]